MFSLDPCSLIRTLAFYAVPILLAGCGGGGTDPEASTAPIMPQFAAVSGTLSVGKNNEGWKITDLGTLGGTDSFGHGINEKGEVVGWSLKTGSDPLGVTHPFLYRNGEMIDIGTLVGGPDSSFTAYALGINNAGQITGSSNSSSVRFQAYVYRNGELTAIGAPVYSQATAISNAGHIVGTSDFTAGNSNRRAFMYRNGSMVDLGTLGGPTSVAYGVNDLGVVAGASDFDASGSTHGFVYRNGKMTDLGVSGGSFSSASGINNAGQVVGYGSHALLYSDGKETDLHALVGGDSSSNSVAYAINNSGHIVGVVYDSGSWSAFLYHDGNTIHLEAIPAVKAAGWSYLNPVAINDYGQIAGTGSINGHNHAFLLSPNLLK